LNTRASRSKSAKRRASRPRAPTHGFTVEQIVDDYGDLCQAITGFAFEVDAMIDIDE